MGIFALPRVKSLLDAGYKAAKLKQKYNYFMLRNIFPSFHYVQPYFYSVAQFSLDSAIFLGCFLRSKPHYAQWHVLHRKIGGWSCLFQLSDSR